MNDIDKFNWHDSLVEKIEIDRSNPGYTDRIDFNINSQRKKYLLRFDDVFWAEFNMNFGIIAQETIYDFNVLDFKNQYLEKLLFKIGDYVFKEELVTYKIEFNSTGSEIIIISKKINILKL